MDRTEFRPIRCSHEKSGVQGGQGVGLHQLARLIEVIVDDGLRIDAEAMIDRGQQFDGMHGIFQRRRGGLVALAMHVAAFDSGSSDNCRVAIWPVVASIGRIVVARRADAALWRATELADGHDHASLRACRDRPGLRSRYSDRHPAWGPTILHAFGQATVMIPRMIVGIGDFGPNHLDHSRAGLDQVVGPADSFGQRYCVRTGREVRPARWTD